MSEYTTQDILRMIGENDGPEGLDLSEKDLGGIALTGLLGFVLGNGIRRS